MSKLKKILLLFAALLAVNGTVLSQNATATVPYFCDFENSAENANWQMANIPVNQWLIGGAMVYAGSSALYVSENNGATPTYYQMDSTNIYAYRRVHLDAGLYDISFYWNFYGALTNYIVHSYMRVFLLPVSATITAGVRYPGLSASRLPQNAIPVDQSGAQPVWDGTWNFFSNPMVQVPQTGDYYLVFFFFGNDFPAYIGGSCYSPIIDNISINAASCPKPYALVKSDSGNGCIRLDWEDAQIPAPRSWTIEYGPRGFRPGFGTRVTTNSKPYTLCGLQTDSLYDIYVQARCPDGTDSPYSDPLRMRFTEETPLCRDFSDLKATGTWCTYGQYEDFGDTVGEFYGPYSDTAIINYGSQNYGDSLTCMYSSRHTVHYDPFETDPRTGGQLNTVPPHANYSVRLGSVYGKWICQSISYQITVDTSAADLLLLEYACVLYNPSGHTMARKPRFMLEILDSTNTLIDRVCYYVDFTPDNVYADTAWHTGIDNQTYWRNWTPVGLAVADYNGQTITVRLTTYACGQGAKNHFGYAYYNLRCQKSRISARVCATSGNSSKAELTAPEGFHYRWRNSANPAFSDTSRTIYITLDSSTYYCDIFFGDDTSACRFTLSMVASRNFVENQYVHADFVMNQSFENCTTYVSFENTSHSSDFNGGNVAYNCNAFFWDFGDSTTSTLANPQPHAYTRFGTYTVMLIASDTVLGCNDTTYQTLTFPEPEVPQIEGDTVVCRDKEFTLTVLSNTAVSYRWNTFDSTQQITRTMRDRPYHFVVHVTDMMGCVTDRAITVLPDSVPKPIFDTLYFADCHPLTVHMLDRNPRSETNSYAWYWGDGDSTIGGNEALHQYRYAGMYKGCCFLKSPKGCRDTVHFEAFSMAYTQAEFQWAPFFGKIQQPEMLMQNLSYPHEPEQNYYLWRFYADSSENRMVDTSAEYEPHFRWPVYDNSDVGFHRIRLIAYTPIRVPLYEFTCIDSIDYVIYILNDFLQFPNVITPNGDGLNDIFEIKNLLDGGNFTDNELYIYNHWGRLVYYKKNIATREDFWDPSLTNEMTGTYYYRFSAKGHTGHVQRNGVVELLR